MSLYTETVCAPGSEGGGRGDTGEEVDDMWESVIIKNDAVKEWNITSEAFLTLSLL